MSDHYDTLGVDATASAADLRAAYLRLARANHPDRFEGQDRVRAEARMQQINEAWNVVGVARKRAEYDARTRRTSSPGTAGGSRRPPGSSGATRGHATFRPFHDDPVDGPNPDIDLDPTPIAGSRALPRWITFLPVILGSSGVVLVGFGTMVSASGVFGLGVIALVLGGVSFLLMPLLVMSRAEKDPDL